MYSTVEPLIWTPLGPFQVSTLQRCPDFRGWLTCKCNIFNHNKCPEYGSVLISEVQISEVPLYIHVYMYIPVQ